MSSKIAVIEARKDTWGRSSRNPADGHILGIQGRDSLLDWLRSESMLGMWNCS